MALFSDIVAANLVLTFFVLSFAYTAGLVIYRIFLSPVAGFPGAFWPKVTFWYEFYYEWIKPGQYYRKIHDMHAQYGENPLQPKDLEIPYLAVSSPISRSYHSRLSRRNPCFGSTLLL